MGELRTRDDALRAIDAAWPMMRAECRSVLGSELHYQAMIYHALRTAGKVPASQLGMNVKQWIPDVQSELFKQFDAAKDVNFRGGFEPIPDIVIFTPDVGGDWRRRQRTQTISRMLVVLEVKASERAGKRLTVGEVGGDIRKLAAHREEVRYLGHEFHPVIVVLDTAPNANERMTVAAITEARHLATRLGVEWRYLAPDDEQFDRPERNVFPNSITTMRGAGGASPFRRLR